MSARSIRWMVRGERSGQRLEMRGVDQIAAEIDVREVLDATVMAFINTHAILNEDLWKIGAVAVVSEVQS